ncbi:AP2 domain-containing protein [Candidatus Macondimonas diazotrophica]|jgi:hypothetical protein|uniref:Fis family transcriptional regulator n=1 Tax=Candidatus Macondimonas diazotrophica TaxID=2305248 RepID=A0A4Z0F4L6_9GAMM|nr:AP2 domain-containing protein [Candidatus Macondimonas diazotrophica]TFZ81222.1 Fis family transcriptional regulator [Candidatus Macondimonas diazotrophica]
MAIEIPLTQGKVAQIDEADLELVSGYKWYAHKDKNTFYAYANVRRADGSWTKVKMHRLILGLTDRKTQADHIDMNGLNNRRSNLRACSNAENMRNRGAYANNTSGFKGVIWQADMMKWRARIKVNGKLKHLGYYSTPPEAHAAYCRAAIELHGEFANFGAR